LNELDGFITHERVVESDWYTYWIFLEGRWEYMPFGMVEAKLWMIVEKEGVEDCDEIWWWLIYWRFGGTVYLLSVCRTIGPFLAVV
jgi:hypothetical protein